MNIPPWTQSTPFSTAGKPVIVMSGGGLPGPGYTFIADESVATDVWRALTSQVGGTAVCWAACWLRVSRVWCTH